MKAYVVVLFTARTGSALGKKGIIIYLSLNNYNQKKVISLLDHPKCYLCL